MTSAENGTDRLKRPRWRFQFSLRSLLIATTLVAVGCSIFLASPWQVGLVAALCLVVSTPVVLIVVLIHGRGYARTFCIGALIPAGIVWCMLGSYYAISLLLAFSGNGPWDENRTPVVVFLGVYYLLVVANGLLAVGTRWLIEARQRRDRQEANPDAQAPPTASTASVSSTEHE